MRRGFGILQALAIMLLVAGMLTVTLRYARVSAHHTRDSYIREQAELYLDSLVERALYEISATDRGTGCWSGLDDTWDAGHGKRYAGSVRLVRYYLKRGRDGQCTGQAIATPESHGYVLLDVEVDATVDGQPVVRLIRRTLQRP
jgi:hypothetical protein